MMCCVNITHPDPKNPGNSTTTSVPTDANGIFTFSNNIPIGKHKIQTTVMGTTYTKAVTVLGNQTVVGDFSQTTDPTTPSPVSSPSAKGVAPTQINLTWTAPTTNTDNSTLIDLAGYNIYRSTVNWFTPSPANLIATIGLTTSYSDTTIAFGTVYYYHIRPVDRAGNIGPPTSSPVSGRGINGAGSIVQITPATVDIGDISWVRQNILNNTTLSITVKSARVYWSGGNAREYDQINFGEGVIEWAKNLKGSGSCTGPFTTSYIINAGASTTLAIRFDNTTLPGSTLIGTNDNIRISLYTGNNCSGTDVAGNYTVMEGTGYLSG